MRVEPQTMAASGDLVFVLERITGTRKGKTQDTKTVLVFKLDNGLVTEVTEFQQTIRQMSSSGLTDRLYPVYERLAAR